MNSKALDQGYNAQQLASDAIKAWKDMHTDQEGKLFFTAKDALGLKALIDAWEKAVDRVRIIRGRPLPGSLRPEKRTKPRKLAELIALDPLDDAHEQVQEQSATATSDEPNQAQG